MIQTQQQDVNSYFNLHVSGVGYLNRFREVKVRKERFFAVDIVALHGDHDEPQRTRFDCKISGADAQKLIRELIPHFERKAKIFASFKLGDLYAEPFIYETGEKKGQTGISLKARLLKLSSVKVDGQAFVLPIGTDVDTRTGVNNASSLSVLI